MFIHWNLIQVRNSKRWGTHMMALLYSNVCLNVLNVLILSNSFAFTVKQFEILTCAAHSHHSTSFSLTGTHFKNETSGLPPILFKWKLLPWTEQNSKLTPFFLSGRTTKRTCLSHRCQILASRSHPSGVLATAKPIIQLTAGTLALVWLCPYGQKWDAAVTLDAPGVIPITEIQHLQKHDHPAVTMTACQKSWPHAFFFLFFLTTDLFVESN